MISHSASSQIDTNGLTSTKFSIETNEHMFRMITEKIYNDPLLACIREISTNAIDGCRLRPDKRISYDVHLPTIEELYFSVRDYGVGLSKEDLLGLYSTMGASNKRDSNDFNGAFGIGKLAPLAYSDTFTVESFHNGNYYSYLVAFGKEAPELVELESSTTPEPNGLKVTVEVNPNDIHYFKNKAEYLYKYFEHKPNLNIPLQLDKKISVDISEDWMIDDSLDNWYNYVLMSDILYQIPNNTGRINDQRFNRLVIKAPTGAVSINPGREALSTDNATVDYLNNAFKQVLDDFLSDAFSQINKLDTEYDKANLYKTLSDAAPSSVREGLQSLIAPSLALLGKDRYGTYRFSHYNPNIEFKSLTPYYKSLRNQSDINTQSLSGISFFIADKKTNWRPALDEIPTRYALIFTRPTGVDFDDFVTSSKDYISSMGIPEDSVLYASDIVTDDYVQQKSIREGIYVSTYYSGYFGQSTKCNPDRDYLYVKLSGTSFDEDYSLDALTSCLNYIENAPLLVGVPKKYLPLAKQNDRFTPALDYVQEHLKDAEFILNNLRYNFKLSCDVTEDLVPSMLTNYLNEKKDYDDFLNSSSTKKEIYYKEQFKSMQSLVPSITLEEFTPRYSEKALFKAYPLLEKINDHYYFKDESLLHYLKLEKHYELLNHQQSDLSSPAIDGNEDT
jgi:hypothetical protein